MSIFVVNHDRPEPVRSYPSAACELDGTAAVSVVSRDDYSLWLIRAELDPNARLTWDTEHGDEVVVVEAGRVTMQGQECTSGSVLIVESGVAAELRATSEATLLNFGPADPTPPSDGVFGAPAVDGHGIHVVAAEGRHHGRSTTAEGAVIDTRCYADSTCATCRVTLLRVAGDRATRVPSHTHSQDELIHVLDGELHVGSLTVAAGMTVAIPAGQRYGFRTPGPFSFVNYRRDVSSIVGRPGSEPRLETADALGFLAVAPVPSRTQSGVA